MRPSWAYRRDRGRSHGSPPTDSKAQIDVNRFAYFSHKIDLFSLDLDWSRSIRPEQICLNAQATVKQCQHFNIQGRRISPRRPSRHHGLVNKTCSGFGARGAEVLDGSALSWGVSFFGGSVLSPSGLAVRSTYINRKILLFFLSPVEASGLARTLMMILPSLISILSSLRIISAFLGFL